MAKPRFVLTLSLALLAVTSCKPRHSGSNANATFEDQKPGSDQSWTESRSIAFDKYAEDLLNYSGNEAKTHNELQLQLEASFKAAGILNADPLGFYTLSLGPLDECFGEDKGDYSIWWSSNRDEIKKQIENVAYFIRDSHYVLMGKNSGPFSFRQVIICPEEKVGAKMLLKGYQLYIGVPYSMGHYQVMQNRGGGDSLENVWNSGAPMGFNNTDGRWFASIRAALPSKVRAEAMARAVWKIFNPLSPFRVAIRKVLHENGKGLANQLRALGGGNVKVRLAKEFLMYQNKEGSVVDPLAFNDDIRARLNRITEDQAALFAKNWACSLEDSALRAEVEADSLSVMNQQIHNENNNITKDVRAGLVSVVNHHRIGVDVGIGGGSGKYAKYVPVVSTRNTNINTTTRAGLVAVDTSDDISVDLGVALNVVKTMQSSGLEQSLLAAEGGRDLCPKP